MLSHLREKSAWMCEQTSGSALRAKRKQPSCDSLRDVHKKPNHSLTSCGTCSFLRRFAQGSSAVGAQTTSSPRRRVRPPWRSSSPWACCGATTTMESSHSTLRSVARRIDEMTQARAPALNIGRLALVALIPTWRGAPPRRQSAWTASTKTPARVELQSLEHTLSQTPRSAPREQKTDSSHRVWNDAWNGL